MTAAESIQNRAGSAPSGVGDDEALHTNTKFVVSERQKAAQLLASGYTQAKRTQELISITIFMVLCVIACYRLYTRVLYLSDWLILVPGALLGMLLADFFSGLAHWASDTWGDISWPLVGQTFIRSFREHHVDPQAITRHDVVESNGDNFLVGVLPVVVGHAMFNITEYRSIEIFLVSVFVLLSIFVAITNQIHKWSHTLKPPAYVRVLQDYHIILSRQNHNIHHRHPFDKNYCITTGWLNAPFEKIGFFKKMEQFITYTTGAVPRSDDMQWTKFLVTSTTKKANDE